MTGQPSRSPQICNCSIAAARNVSPAASSTFSPLRELRGELADRCCFARAVDADDQNDERPLAMIDLERLSARSERTLDFGRKDLLHFLDADLFVVTAASDRLPDAFRRRKPQIGADQHILKLVEHRSIELALGENGSKALADRAR